MLLRAASVPRPQSRIDEPVDVGYISPHEGPDIRIGPWLAALLSCLAARAAPIAPVLKLGDYAGGTDGLNAASIGDVNGDGYPDTAVGDPAYAPSAGEQYGRVYVHYGSSSGPGVEPSWLYQGTINFGNIGFSVAGGDVNGDGYSDLLVASRAQSSFGIVFAFLGSPTGLHNSPDWFVEPSDNAGSLGESIASVDVDGDRYDDVLVGSAGCANGGCVLLYRGGPSGPASGPSWTVSGNQSGARLGRSVAAAGDVNHDGYQDVVIGADSYDNGQTDEGRAYVYHGSAVGLPAAPDRVLELNQAGARFGYTVAGAGDVDQDQFADIVVSARYYDGAFQNEGGVFLFKGSATGVAPTPSWQVTSGQTNAEMSSVALAGDFDGDGRADLLVGAPRWDPGQDRDFGQARVYRGNGSAFTTTPDDTATGTTLFGELGLTVAGLNDTDGDGFGEIFIGDFVQGFVYTLMTAHPAAAVPDAGPDGVGITISKTLNPPPSSLRFAWPKSCGVERDYAIYEGHLGVFTSHVPVVCGTGQRTDASISMPSFDAYYLVVPVRLGAEGSYGRNANDQERPASVSACWQRQIAPCP